MGTIENKHGEIDMKTFTFNGMEKNADNMYAIVGLVVTSSQVSDVERLGSLANAHFMTALDMAKAAKNQGCEELANIVYVGLDIESD